MRGLVAITKLLLLLTLIQVISANRKWDDLRVRFDILKSKGFFKIPRSIHDPLLKDFSRATTDTNTLPLDFYCHAIDPRACFMYDRKGHIAGVQISYLKEDVSGVDANDYDYTGNPNFIRTMFFGIPAYSFRAYFTNPERLTVEGRKNTEETAEGLWFYLDGKLIHVPRKQPTEDKYENFYKQSCIRSMGQHYYYKVDKGITDCRSSFPVFLLYDEGSLVGFGLSNVGKGSKGLKRNWYETPPAIGLPLITPNRAKCMDDLANKYGVTSLHVYFVDEPWTISCSAFDRLINYISSWITWGTNIFQ